MADEKDDGDDKGKTPPPADDDTAADDSAETAPGGFTETDVPELVELLAQHKIILGEGVTAANFADRLKASLHTKAAHDGTGDGGMMNADTQAQATEVAMSADWKSRAERAEAKLVGMEQQSLLRRINVLVETQRISKPLAEQLRKQANTVSLSLDPATGEVAGTPLIYRVEAYEALGKGNAFALSHDRATEQAAPHDLSGDDRAAQERCGDELAAIAGVRVKQAA